MISSIIKIVILLSKFIMGNSSFWTYSSCVQDSHWIHGNGAPIKSWTQSILPTFNSKDSPFSKIIGIHVTFQYQSIPRVDLIGWFSNNWKTTLSKSIFLLGNTWISGSSKKFAKDYPIFWCVLAWNMRAVLCKFFGWTDFSSIFL